MGDRHRESPCTRGGAVFAAYAITNPSSCLECNVLLLNAHYAALRVVSVRRAFIMLFKRDPTHQPVAEVVNIEDGRYVSYDFEDWAQLSAIKREENGHDEDWIRTVRTALMAPRIIRVLTFHRVPRQEVKFNRRNVLARDDNTCQYCLRRFPATELTLDHVAPRSQGGSTTWDNVVCACSRCNVRKGGRTPAQAGVRLQRIPIKPKQNPTLNIRLSERRYATWRPFLDRADWDVESAGT